MAGLIPIVQILIHSLESLHDYRVIKGADPKEVNHNRAWHKIDSVMWVIIHGLIAYLAGHWLFILSGLATRLFILQVGLNHLRKLPETYLGDKGIDGFCKRYIGPEITLILKFIIYSTTCYYAFKINP